MSANRSAGVGRWAGTVGGRIVHWAATLTGRVVRVWRVLPHERRLAVVAALGLFVTLFLPWYQETVIVPGSRGAASANTSVTGWAAFSFVEAAVLLVAAGVLTLLFQRAEGRAFHLPGGDGWVIMAAGGWACVLVIWRIFDKQTASVHGPGVSISGIEWGIFVALAGAAFLAYAGSRIRAAHQPEPPLPGDDVAGAPGQDRDVAESRPRGSRRRPAPDWAPSASDELAGPAAPRQVAGQGEGEPAPRRAPGGRAGPSPAGPSAVGPSAAGPSAARQSAARPFFERPPGWLTARPQHLGPAEFDPGSPRRPAEAAEPAPRESREPAPEDEAPTRHADATPDEAPTRYADGPAERQRAPYRSDPEREAPKPYRAESPRDAPLPPSTPAARRQQSDEQLTIPLEHED